MRFHKKIMPATSRQKILEYLRKHRAASAGEIARVLRMTPANARRHLAILAADGRVEAVAAHNGGRGRPEKAYHLSEALVGDNLAALTEALLAEAGPGVSMEAVGRRLAGESIPSRLPLARRLAMAVERLNAMHYQARWEAGPLGPRVMLGHCPYAAIIQQRPQLCRMDGALLTALLDEAVQPVKVDAAHAPPCIFLLAGR